MKIGIITGEYPPMEGGVGDYTRELSKSLLRLGHRVHILTSSQPNAIDSDNPSPEICYEIRNWSILQCIPQIKQWLQDTDLDIINIQYQAAAYQMEGTINLLPKWLKITHGPSCVVTFHDLLPPYLFPKAGPLREWSIWYLARHARGVITTNEADRQKLIRHLGSSHPPIGLIPIGSNIPTNPPQNYTPAEWRKKHNVLENDILLGFFGFMNRNKGVDILISAVSRLYHAGIPVKLVFIGGRTGTSDITNSAYAKHIDARIEDEGIASIVLHTGFVLPEEVSAALLAVDLCTLPYLEGASLRHGTLHAALTHGCAIITTKSTEVNPLLEQGAVFLIPPDNTEALVEAIIQLNKNAEMRSSLKAQAIKLARSFSWESIAEETARFFNQCTG
jgi:glycosyltransferase involved in cell wall biosynthesis